MDLLISVFVGVPVGILGSLVAWWAMWRVLSVRGSFSNVICVQEAFAPKEYRVKFIVDSYRPLMEVEFHGLLFSPGDHGRGGSQPIVAIPLLQSRFAYIGGKKLRSKKVVNGITALPHRILVFRPDLIDQVDFERLGAESFVASSESPSQSSDLLTFLMSRRNSVLEVVCVASDGYSGSRRAIKSAAYTVNDLVLGEFERGRSIEYRDASTVQEKE
ncbi:hypothetical protein [Rhodococcus sp. 1168]|uniref:hypothetical protein n=1 Tax=Rhodococcus sp. 1168 TaxID=2018041 RepID=UPI000F7402E5|nr:hypothetical protein [Rhodococcus sp. 1168]